MLRPKRKITKREIRHDPLLETLYSVQKYFEKYKKRIFQLGGSLLGIVIILLISSSWRASSRSVASELLAKSVSSYNNGDYATAVDELDLLIAEYPNTPSGREALFYMGHAYIHLENTTAAKQMLEEYQNKGKNRFFLCATLESLATIAESEDRFKDAAELFQEASRIADYSFTSQQDSINAAANWMKAKEYNKAEKILEALQSKKTTHRLIKEQIDEYSSGLKILSRRSD